MVESRLIDEWLTKADEDYEFACSILDETTFYSKLCFHFHQAAEKYLKAYIVAKELDFRKIHDLPVLLKTCLKGNSDLADLEAACKFLNRFYIETRYPVHWPTHYTKDETVKAKECVEEIRHAIRTLIKPVPPCDPERSFQK